MILGTAAGTAASLAVSGAGSRVHAVDMGALQSALLAVGQKTHTGPAPTPSPPSFGCMAGRCIPLASGAHGSSRCDAGCQALQTNEWLALKEYFAVHNATSAVCTKAGGSVLKKSEENSHYLPPSQLYPVAGGAVLSLRSWVVVDSAYYLFALVPAPNVTRSGAGARP